MIVKSIYYAPYQLLHRNGEHFWANLILKNLLSAIHSKTHTIRTHKGARGWETQETKETLTKPIKNTLQKKEQISYLQFTYPEIQIYHLYRLLKTQAQINLHKSQISQIIPNPKILIKKNYNNGCTVSS